jgi:hypothetical protein
MHRTENLRAAKTVFGCDIAGHPTAQNLPWTLDASSPTRMQLSAVAMAQHFKAGCLLGSQMTISTATPLTLTMNSDTAATSATATGSTSTNFGPVTAAGSFALTPSGTYGIK